MPQRMTGRAQQCSRARQSARQVDTTDDGVHGGAARPSCARRVTDVQKPGTTRCDESDAMEHEALTALVDHDIADPVVGQRPGARAHLVADVNRWLHRAAIAGEFRASRRRRQLAQKGPPLCLVHHLTYARLRSIRPYCTDCSPHSTLKFASNILWAGLLSACTFDSSAPNLALSDGGNGGDASLEDGGSADADLPPEGRRHLQLSEVKTTGSGTEFIEIFNPTDASIGLGDYYLADNKSYPFLAGAFGAGPRPTVSNVDFIARFPDGASIAAGAVQVIAVRPNDFVGLFGVAADYAIAGQGEPEMRTAYPSSIGAQCSLTDTGEVITLFYWDGAADLVVDIDIVNAGAETRDDNNLVVKTDLSVDGPDSGSVVSVYLKDLATLGPMPTSIDNTQSYQRIAPEAGAEQQSGPGNGIFGHDETSEDTALTWAIGNTPTPGSVSGLSGGS